MIKSLIIVGIGSFFGGAMRYLVSCMLKTAGGFPYATFTVNVVGCFLIGLLYGWFSRYSNPASAWCLLLTTGFCGGFTTFSTFSNESLHLLQSGSITLFLLYVFGSLLLGLLAVAGGYGIMKM